MTAVAPEDLVVLLDMLGDGRARGDVVLRDWAANALVDILMTLPGPRGRRGIWSLEIHQHALKGLSDGKQIKPLAREIAALTGQPESSVRRRLQELDKRRAKRPRAKAS